MSFFMIFFTLIFNLSGNIHNFYQAECENNKKYIFYTDTNGNGKIEDEQGNILYGGIIVDNTSDNLVTAFYCYQNDLYVVVPQRIANAEIYTKLSLYKLENTSLVFKDSFENTYSENVIVRDDKLIYFDYGDSGFYEVDLKEKFLNKTLIAQSDYNFVENFFYIPESQRIIYKKNNFYQLVDSEGITVLSDIPSGALLWDVKEYDGDLFFLYYKNGQIIIKNSLSVIYTYTKSDNESFSNENFLYINDDGVYFFSDLNKNGKKLFIGVSPEFKNTKSNEKIIDDELIRIYPLNKGIYYLKRNGVNSTDIIVLNEPVKPAKPVVSDDIRGVLDNFPAGFEFANFNQDKEYFIDYELDIAPNENFNSVYYGDIVSEYNSVSSYQYYQFSDYFNFQRDKPYYMRIKYKGIMGDSEYDYVRFIITDLGEITSFKITDKTTNSENFTNDNLVRVSLAKEGKVDYIQIFQKKDFENEVGILEFNENFEMILPDEEKVYTYFVRPVVIDEDNGKLIGGHQKRMAKITLDKTAPTLPLFITQNGKEFYKDSVRIEWENSNDNLSGIKSYEIKITDSLNNILDKEILNADKNIYIGDIDFKEGVYTAFLKACDNADNCSLENKINFNVISKPDNKPYKPVVVRPKNNEEISSFPLSVTWMKSDDPDGDEVTYSLIISKDKDFNKKEIEIHLLKKQAYNVEYLSQGHYYLKVYATDINGNNSDETVLEFDVINPKSNETSGCGF